MMMPLTMNPPHRRPKMTFWAEFCFAGRVCVSEDIIEAFATERVAAEVMA
jgi:hypothetical protein